VGRRVLLEVRVEDRVLVDDGHERILSWLLLSSPHVRPTFRAEQVLFYRAERAKTTCVVPGLIRRLRSIAWRAVHFLSAAAIAKFLESK
jgi:hypothetical protein